MLLHLAIVATGSALTAKDKLAFDTLTQDDSRSPITDALPAAQDAGSFLCDNAICSHNLILSSSV